MYILYEGNILCICNLILGQAKFMLIFLVLFIVIANDYIPSDILFVIVYRLMNIDKLWNVMPPLHSVG